MEGTGETVLLSDIRETRSEKTGERHRRTKGKAATGRYLLDFSELFRTLRMLEKVRPPANG